MMDIDSVFHNRFGAESLSQLSAVLHRGYYKVFYFLQYIHFKLMEVFTDIILVMLFNVHFYI